MKNGWLTKFGERFYAFSHSDSVLMKDGGTLTEKIKSILLLLKGHHHHSSDVNDFADGVNNILKNAGFAPKNHAESSTNYGVSSPSNYGHVRTAGGGTDTSKYAYPFSVQFNGVQTSLNTTNLTYNGIYSIRFTGSATGAPAGLTSGTTYYATLQTLNYAQTSTVNTSYGVTQILFIPKIGKLYYRFVQSSSAFGDWIDVSALSETIAELAASVGVLEGKGSDSGWT